MQAARELALNSQDTYGFTAEAIYMAVHCTTSADLNEVVETGSHVAEALLYMTEEGDAEVKAERARQCALLQELFGPVIFRSLTVAPAVLVRNNGAVPNLAQALYDESRFGDLPILADALEEAGCVNETILSHCRQPGEHVRGCWALDLILGKE